MDSDSVRGINRRRLLGWGGLAAGVAAAGVTVGATLLDAQPGHAVSASTDSATSGDDQVPPDTLPGGAYDRYVAELAAKGEFSGVVLLSHQGRTVLSRSYGLADQEKGIRNSEQVAFNLSSAGKPFGAVAVLQLVQQGKINLSDTVGKYLTGYAKEIAEQVNIHQLLCGTSGISSPEVDVQRVFDSEQEVHEYYEQWARQSKLVAAPGTSAGHEGADIAIPAQIVEAVAGVTYWDYVQENIFRRCGMTGTAFYTRPQWLTEQHLAHPYMTLADGTRVDAVRNLDKSSPAAETLGENPGRNFIDAPGNGGFATAPDLVRFAQALGNGMVLDRPYAELLTGAKLPHPGAGSFMAYDLPVHIVGGQWVFERAGADPGIGANWNIYPYTGWVGVILSNYDNLPLAEMSQREVQAVTGQSVSGSGGG